MRLFRAAAAGLCALLLASSVHAGEPITWLGPITLPTGVASLGQVPVSSTNPLPVTGSISATTTTKATAADPTQVEGSTTNPLSSDLAGYLRTTLRSVKLNGAAVATFSNLVGVSDGTNQQQVVAPIALGDGVNGNNMVSIGGWLFNGTTWDRLRGDATNGMKVQCATGCSGALAQGSTTSGQTGGLIMGAVTTAAPTYTTAQTSPVSLDVHGSTRVLNVDSTGAAIDPNAALPAGTNLLGSVNLGTLNGAALDATLAETHGTKAAGTAATKSNLMGLVFNTSLPTLTTGQQAALQADSSGRLLNSDTQAQTKLDTLNTSINSATPAGANVIGYVTSAFDVATTITRPANTTAYTGGDVVGGALDLGVLGLSAGSVEVTGLQLEADIAAIPAGQTSWVLHLYNVTPPSALADNAVFDVPSGDRASYLGSIAFATLADLGSTLYVEANNLNKRVKLAGTHLFGYLVTVGGFTPAANSEVYKVTLHTMAR